MWFHLVSTTGLVAFNLKVHAVYCSVHNLQLVLELLEIYFVNLLVFVMRIPNWLLQGSLQHVFVNHPLRLQIKGHGREVRTETAQVLLVYSGCCHVLQCILVDERVWNLHWNSFQDRLLVVLPLWSAFMLILCNLELRRRLMFSNPLSCLRTLV